MSALAASFKTPTEDSKDDDEGDVESSLRIDDRLLRALPPTSILQDEEVLSLGTSIGVVNAAAPEEAEPIFETSFDLTRDRLRHVFGTFDTDEDGKIDYESLKRGLTEWQQQAGMQITAMEGRAFRELVSFLDSDDSGDITFEEFAEGFRLLMLRALLPRRKQQPSSDDAGAPLEVLDYDATRLERAKVGGDSGEFFFQRRDAWVKTRWVNVATSDTSDNAIALTMKRLAVKYLLHPLALEDALDTAIHRPKVEVFSSHYFLIIPVFSLDTPSERDTSAAGKPGGAGDVELPQRWYYHLLCSCCRSKLGSDAKERLQSRRPPLLRVRVEMICIFVNVPRNDTIITCNQAGGRSPLSGVGGARWSLWQRVQGELEKPYSRLRQYDAQYLTYALLDESVDLLVPIVKTMRREIAGERDYLRKTDFARGLRRVHEIRVNLDKVCQTIKPFVRVLTHVIEDDAICPGVTVYLRDVLDNLECADDDLRQLIEQCQALDSDADKFRDRQMNRTLYTLTIISAIFLPAQFLTGVWGMNFQDMPELQKSWGYEMFWVITVTMTVALLVLFFIFGRLRSFED